MTDSSSELTICLILTQEFYFSNQVRITIVTHISNKNMKPEYESALKEE